jgi:hypothetical protein
MGFWESYQNLLVGIWETSGMAKCDWIDLSPSSNLNPQRNKILDPSRYVYKLSFPSVTICALRDPDWQFQPMIDQRRGRAKLGNGPPRHPAQLFCFTGAW